MAQVFRPSANSVARASLVVLLLLVVGGFSALDQIHRSPYFRYTKVDLPQPVPFSHKHHVNMGIDCRYCHTSVEVSPFANIPPTRTCMNCHSVLFNDQPTLAPVVESWNTGRSLEWTRVHDLPDHVYFNHSIHVSKGIGCSTCHGRVDEMPLMYRDQPLFMKWCLECHREPERFIRPREEIYNLEYPVPNEGEALERGRRLVEEYDVQTEAGRLVDCWICHR